MLCFLVLILSCEKKVEYRLHPVSVSEFRAFVEATDYVTDAEKFGWSIVQQDIHNFETRENAIWTCPDGVDPPPGDNYPVTQVSYNDAKAYCNWIGARLPTYDEYWTMVEDDVRMVVEQNIAPISPVDEVNVLGNVWDITESTDGQSTRLAGGSLFCNTTTCNGTSRDRELIVDLYTGNIHIGFAYVEEVE